MGIGPQGLGDGPEFFKEGWRGVGTSHRTFQADPQRDLLELRAVVMLAIVQGMDQFVHQRIEHFDWIGQYRRNENLIQAIRCGGTGPALTDVV